MIIVRRTFYFDLNIKIHIQTLTVFDIVIW